MANISVRLNEQEEELFKTYAEFMDETLSTLFKKALLEKIEDEFDLKVGQKALAEYKQRSSYLFCGGNACKIWLINLSFLNGLTSNFLN